jgi:glycosyltransferase involved in cell wall biosynthesis
MADAYAACDVVVMPSFWEGFGNPAVESAVHLRPLSIGPYPVALELAEYGFQWFSIAEPQPLADWLRHRDGALLERNLEVASRSFSLADLPGRVSRLMERAGWTSW